MIFGNPGVYDESGRFNNFAIQIDNLIEGFATLNLCLDMKIYPSDLAYNSKDVLLSSLNIGKEILSYKDDELYYLNDVDLMVELIRRTFNISYQIEKMILEGKIDFREVRSPDDISSFLDNYLIEPFEDRRFWWDIDTFEYTNRGVYPFLLSNSQGKTKVVVIVEKISNNNDVDQEVSRFFTSDLMLREKISFFDKEHWSIQISEINTRDLVNIIDQASLFLEE